jgi:hypothetical protein
MNDLLQLKGDFNQKKHGGGGAPPSLPTGAVVKLEHLKKLLSGLEKLNLFWNENTLIEGALISVYYTRVIPKSRRIQGYLSNGKISANSSIKGARFAKVGNIRKHIITHFTKCIILDITIERLKKVIVIVNEIFGNQVTNDNLHPSIVGSIDFDRYGINKTIFLNFIVDSFFVEKFDIVENVDLFTSDSIISIFDTNTDTKQLMEKIGINILSNRIIDDTTLYLSPDELSILQSRAPYLISMAVEDFSQITKEEVLNLDSNGVITIQAPTNEPIIGVIDTLFDESVYFADWVEFRNMLDDNIPIEPKDYNHGTSVSSIIVDGHTTNPNLNDGCGRFRVRHFGVAKSTGFSSFTIIRTIKEIVASNRDIKVWNLCFGSLKEINQNFISPEAAALDKIQFENDVIFVISGTNKPKEIEEDMAIGSPADSINSLVVNAVDSNNNPATYTRRGIVLSFFNKPDICCFGGGADKYIRVCTPVGEKLVCGTSYAAPWITRKIAYLIHIIGLSREVAKALIIDSAAGWKNSYSINESSLRGHGVVPIRIEDILYGQEDEIRFVLSGTSEKYDTYNYNIPIPVNNNEHPYIARATLCYIPKCSRNQGVDYTNTELDLYFGRINDEGKIKSINKNKQSIEGVQSFYLEEDARAYYRKWDNSKHIKEELKNRTRARKAYTNKLWGISIKTKERLNTTDGEGITFGVVITLKEINGVNRVDTFIQQCSLRGWLVNKINIDNRIDIYTRANEEIEFE